MLLCNTNHLFLSKPTSLPYFNCKSIPNPCAFDTYLYEPYLVAQSRFMIFLILHGIGFQFQVTSSQFRLSNLASRTSILCSWLSNTNSDDISRRIRPGAWISKRHWVLRGFLMVWKLQMSKWLVFNWKSVSSGNFKVSKPYGGRRLLRWHYSKRLWSKWVNW